MGGGKLNGPKPDMFNNSLFLRQTFLIEHDRGFGPFMEYYPSTNPREGGGKRQQRKYRKVTFTHTNKIHEIRRVFEPHNTYFQNIRRLQKVIQTFQKKIQTNPLEENNEKIPQRIMSTESPAKAMANS